jgi:hypothetical protein
VEQQHTQQLALARAAELDDLSVDRDLELAKDPELHRSLVTELPTDYRGMERCRHDARMNTEYLVARVRSANADAVPELLVELRILLGEVARATGETPRTVLEEEFKQAPSDEFWRATIGVAR